MSCSYRPGYMTGFLFKEVIKVGRILKAKGISDFSNTPIRMLEECFCFADDPFSNMASGGFAGYFFLPSCLNSWCE